MERELLPCPLPYPEAAQPLDLGTSQLSRATRSRLRKTYSWKAWVNSAVDALNSLYGHGQPAPGKRPSLAQTICGERVSAACRSMGAPPQSLSATAAFVALCGARPGYSDPLPEQRAIFQRELVSLPRPGAVLAQGEDLLTGADLDAWKNWQRVLLNDPATASARRDALGVERPYSDPHLVRSSVRYACFVKDLLDRGLVRLVAATEPTVGAFFAPKKDGRQRLLLDMRIAHTDFKGPMACITACGCSMAQP